MITVVIADDEPMIVKGLKKLFDWEKYNITIIGTARDGETALDLVRKHNPDLLISDINMPGLSGIELIRELKIEASRTKVIFISGFHEFEYAHAAIKYGAVDYLLKPIHEEQLETAIMKALKLEHSNSRNDFEDSQDQFPPGVPDFGPGYYKQIHCQFDSFAGPEAIKSEKEILCFSAGNLIRDNIPELVKFWLSNNKDQIYIVLHHQNQTVLEQLMENLPANLITLLKEELQEKISIAIGKTVSKREELKESFRSAQEAMKNKYYYENQQIMFYKNINQRRYSVEKLYTLQSEIAEAILKSEMKITNKKIACYLTVLKDVTFGNRETTMSYCLGTMIFIRKSLEEVKIPLDILNFDDQEFLKEIQNIPSFEDLSKWIFTFLNTVQSKSMEFREIQIHPDINKIKEYITENYMENIKLKDLSDLVYLHPNYLSGHFKKITGQNFKDYLTERRMSEAEKMIVSTDMKVYEIAEQVGFTDYRHFSEVFKKKFGINPRDYKKKQT